MSALEQAERDAEDQLRRLLAVRHASTEQVVQKAMASGALRVDLAAQADPHVLPDPTSLLLVPNASNTSKSSALPGKSSPSTALAITSPHPFPARADRKLDSFQQRAWERFQSEPEAVVREVEGHAGQHWLRVAVADRMQSAVCVNCHNNHPLSPLSTWKLGDVGGVMEISLPLADGAATAGLVSMASARAAGIALLGVALVCYAARAAARRVKLALEELTRSVHQLGSGDASATIPHRKRADEIGQLARELQAMKDQAVEKQMLESDSYARDERDRKLAEERREAERRSLEEMRAQALTVADLLESSVMTAIAAVKDSGRDLLDISVAMQEGADSALSGSRSALDEAKRSSEEIAAVASSAEQLSASIADIHERTEHSSQVAQSAAERAARIDEVVGSLVAFADRISGVVGIIKDIARHTNLLASPRPSRLNRQRPRTSPRERGASPRQPAASRGRCRISPRRRATPAKPRRRS